MGQSGANERRIFWEIPHSGRRTTPDLFVLLFSFVLVAACLRGPDRDGGGRARPRPPACGGFLGGVLCPACGVRSPGPLPSPCPIPCSNQRPRGGQSYDERDWGMGRRGKRSGASCERLSCPFPLPRLPLSPNLPALSPTYFQNLVETAVVIGCIYLELELELIQTHMTQKPLLRAEGR